MISSFCGMPATPGLIVFMFSAGKASASITPPASTSDTTGRATTRSRTQPRTRAPPGLGGLAALTDDRNAAFLDLVAELGDHRGEDGHGAEHGDRDDDDRADRH